MSASNIGCDDKMDWIQINPQLFSSFPPDSRYLIGVSGGRDSIALLRCLTEAGYKNLIVCHLDHRVRGRSSQGDARFVEKLAAKYDVDCEFGSANVPTLAKKKKMSMETAAREARYAFFADAASKRRCHTIFLAHHADDLVETFFINLFRGAGLTGLASMREISTRRIENVDLTIVRPLLGVWRDQIDKYVREHRLKFREDASNKNLAPLRNRIRRAVIPYLEKTLGRNIRQSIWRTATIAAEEENWLENQLPEEGQLSITYVSKSCPGLLVKKLRALPIALQRRTILKWLRAQNVSEVGFETIERVRSLLDPASRTAKTNLSQNRHVRRRAGKIFLE